MIEKDELANKRRVAIAVALAVALVFLQTARESHTGAPHAMSIQSVDRLLDTTVVPGGAAADGKNALVLRPERSFDQDWMARVPFLAESLDDAVAYWNTNGETVRMVPHDQAIRPDKHESYAALAVVQELGGRAAGRAGGDLLTLELGSSELCSGRWTPYDAGTIRDIAVHEMGHLLGYGHSNNTNSPMYHAIRAGYFEPCLIFQSDPILVEEGRELVNGVRLFVDQSIRVEANGYGGDFEFCVFDNLTKSKDCLTSFGDALVWEHVVARPGPQAFYVTCVDRSMPCVVEFSVFVNPGLRGSAELRDHHVTP